MEESKLEGCSNVTHQEWGVWLPFYAPLTHKFASLQGRRNHLRTLVTLTVAIIQCQFFPLLVCCETF